MKLNIVILAALAAMVGAAILNRRKDEFNHSNRQIQGRLVNGYTAQKGEAPYIVLFDDGTQYCAGSIINPNWVLTAAHCVQSPKFEILAGLHSRYDRSKAQIRNATLSTHFIGHREFKGGASPNDIGLVYVSPPFVLDPTGEPPVDKISLPSGKYKETGKGKVYGWGRLLNESFPTELQTNDVDIIGYDECKARFEVRYESSDPLDACNICTYTEGALKSTNRNDSGGPLVRYTPDGLELVGIISWGTAPNETDPQVYTMVSAFKNWISESILNFTLPVIL